MMVLLPTEQIEHRIFMIRGHRVMLDTHLAELYGVSTKRLNEQVKRNPQRFPSTFMFQLAPRDMTHSMRSHFATASTRNIRFRPFVFTEHGALMLASVLNSPVAINASIAVVQAFVRLRELLTTHKDLARKISEMENKYDSQFKAVFDAIRELMKPIPALKPAKLQLIPVVKGFKKE